MKNKYFGDKRDLFKYDLILKIIQGVDLIHRFLFIPMLTSDDDSSDGNKTDYTNARAGVQNKELIAYLRSCLNENRRNIEQIEPYFKLKGIKAYIYRALFINENRKNYFESLKLKRKFFSNSLIFVDPDNGLEILCSREKHFLYREAKDIYNYMDENSILMIYQHFPRNEGHKKNLCRRTNELENLTGDLPIYISDNEIVFFLLAKNDEIKNQLDKTINEYSRDYPALIVSRDGEKGLGLFCNLRE